MRKIYLKTAVAFLMSACATPMPQSSLTQMSAPASNDKINVFFTPSQDCQDNIIDGIKNSKDNIDIAIFSITNVDIVKAIYVAQKRHVKIRILADARQAATRSSKVKEILDQGINIRVNSIGGYMHNKYAIFDGKKIVSGSYNWTAHATLDNRENCVFISDADVAKYFHDNFEKIWQENTEEKSKEAMAKKTKSKLKDLNATGAEDQMSLF